MGALGMRGEDGQNKDMLSTICEIMDCRAAEAERGCAGNAGGDTDMGV